MVQKPLTKYLDKCDMFNTVISPDWLEGISRILYKNFQEKILREKDIKD